MVTLRRFFPGHDDNDDPWALTEITSPKPHRAQSEPSLLDRILPRHDFRGVEHVTIDATPRDVFDALRSVTLGELRIATMLTNLRYMPARLFGHDEEGRARQNPTFLAASKALRLGEIPDRELVIGYVGTLHDLRDQRFVDLPDLFTFTRFNHPAYEKFAMSFQAIPADDGRTTLVADHRTLALSPATRRKFAVYWYLMVGWSGNLMVRQLLHAIKRRAENHRPIQDVHAL